MLICVAGAAARRYLGGAPEERHPQRPRRRDRRRALPPLGRAVLASHGLPRASSTAKIHTSVWRQGVGAGVACRDSSAGRPCARRDAARERGVNGAWRLVLCIDARRSSPSRGTLSGPSPSPTSASSNGLRALRPRLPLFEGGAGRGVPETKQGLMLGNRHVAPARRDRPARRRPSRSGSRSWRRPPPCAARPAHALQPAVEASAAAGVEGGGVQVGDAAAGIFTGTAFDRVWDVGTLTEKSGTVLLRAPPARVFRATLRQLLYVFYRETRALETAAAATEPPAEGGGVPRILREDGLRKKVEDGDASRGGGGEDRGTRASRRRRGRGGRRETRAGVKRARRDTCAHTVS